MELVGVAVKLPEPIWVNKQQEEVDEENAWGRKVTHLITRPEYIVFVDEVGSNVSQEGDGAIGGEKKIVTRGTVPKESASVNDTHFTVLGFTACTGEPIMCAVIVEGKTLKPDTVTGLNVFATKEGSENDADFISRNTGPDKMYPYGPTCSFKGKDVPCIVASSDEGGITSKLLVDFLKAMDALDLFPREEGGPQPFLLLDGHNSRFEVPFLEYVNKPETRWITCIGVPYGTSYWQVGDSSEQNGSYKMALTRAKKELVLKKQRMCFTNARVEPYEVVIIVNEAWKKSFGRSTFNKEAIAARGWYPLTRNLLDHPEIAATAENIDNSTTAMDASDAVDSSQSNSQPSIATSLNFRHGFANTVMVDILQNIDRDAVREQIRINQQEGQQAQNTLMAAKRLTAGILFKSGEAWLGPAVLEEQLRRLREKQNKEREQADRLRADYEKKKQAHDKAVQDTTDLPVTRWTTQQLRALIAFKKLKTDKWPQLKTRAQMLEVWQQIQYRPAPPPPSPYEEEAQDVNGINEEDIGETDEV
jgi:hypothetical protein